MSELIITNGDSAAELLAAAGLAGRILPWRDVLHEGPLLPAARLEDLSETRARYLSERFDLPFAETRTEFLARDAVVSAHGLFDRVAIWLEHDLYDQLQLLQVLHFFHRENRTEGLFLVQADDFIGSQSPDTVLRFGQTATPVTREAAAHAAAIWDSLTRPTPEPVVRRLREPMGMFPFLADALRRFLEELPSAENGLSRSAQVIVSVIGEGDNTARDVFARLLASEEAAFMGDWSAFRLIDDLAIAPEPLVSGLPTLFPCRGDAVSVAQYLAAPLSLTPLGEAVLAGEADVIAVNGIDCWWAGTHMTSHETWRWDGMGQMLVPPGGARA